MFGWWLLDNSSTPGVLHLLYWASGLALVMVQCVLVRLSRAATSRRGHAAREAVWAIVPALLLVWLGLLSHRTIPEVTYDRQVALESGVHGGAER